MEPARLSISVQPGADLLLTVSQVIGDDNVAWSFLQSTVAVAFSDALGAVVLTYKGNMISQEPTGALVISASGFALDVPPAKTDELRLIDADDIRGPLTYQVDVEDSGGTVRRLLVGEVVMGTGTGVI